MYAPSPLTDLLFFDCETASGTATHAELSPILQKHWERRAERTKDFDAQNPNYAQIYEDFSAIHAEFGRVVCISCGVPSPGADGQLNLIVKSFYGSDERDILTHFAESLDKFWPGTGATAQNTRRRLVGHNIKGFDVPYLCRRYRLLGLPLPAALMVWGKKPWDLTHLIDTQELWQFGDNRTWVALELLTELYGLPTPKDALGGEYVTRAFWKDGAYEQIAVYCEADVLATSQVAFKLWGHEPIQATHVHVAERSMFA